MTQSYATHFPCNTRRSNAIGCARDLGYNDGKNNIKRKSDAEVRDHIGPGFSKQHYDNVVMAYGQFYSYALQKKPEYIAQKIQLEKEVIQFRDFFGHIGYTLDVCFSDKGYYIVARYEVGCVGKLAQHDAYNGVYYSYTGMDVIILHIAKDVKNFTNKQKKE